MRDSIRTFLGLAAGVGVAILLILPGLVDESARVPVIIVAAIYGAGVGWLGFTAPNLSREEAAEWERKRMQN